MFKNTFSKARIVSALLAAAILIGNAPIGQTNVYAESAPETEVTTPEQEETAPETEETAPEQEETAPEQEETTPEQEETTPEQEETAPETEETDDLPQFNDSSEEELIEAYAASDFSYSTNSTGVKITKYNGTDSVVLIPSELGGKKVTSIGDWAFYNCTSLTSVTIPSSVTSIGNYAFYNCTSLTSVTIPTGVTKIGEWAFNNCTSLTSVTIPTGVTSIGDFAFAYTALKSVTILSGVTSIGDYAFAWCENLASITIPTGVTSIGDWAFYCTSLTSVTIPNSVTSIGNWAFAQTDLKSVTIPAGVTKISDYAFAWCYNLANITISAGVTSIGESAFTGAGITAGTTSVTIPNSVTSIGGYAFGNTALTSVTIPASVTSIGAEAFSCCLSLKNISVDSGSGSFSSVSGVLYSKDGKTLFAYPVGKSDAQFTVPSKVAKIADGAFKCCASLKNFAVEAGNSSYSATAGVLYTKDGKTLVAYPAGKTDSAFTVPSGVSEIGCAAFEDCVSLKSITLPNSVTSIGEDAFSSCIGLTSIAVPSGVTSIGDGTFVSCTGLTSITIPNGVTFIGNSTFGWCKNLTSVTIPNSVTEIDAYAFQACERLTSVTIPSSVTSIDMQAFAYCTNLTSAVFLGSNTQFPEYSSVFSECPKLTIYGFTGSTAEAHAKKENIPFAVIGTPALPAIKATAGDKQVTLSWNAVNPAMKYRVFTYLNGKYTQVGETTSTSYVVKNLTGGTKYGFLVLAYNGLEWSKYTVNNVVYATPVGLVKPVATVAPGKNQATVKWNAISGATKYRIFTYLSGKYTQVGETASTSYVIPGLSGGTKYGFLVLAYNGSAWSTYTANDVVYATPTGIAKPAFTVTPAKNQATVKWNAVNGAKKYRIFTHLNGKYTQVGETTSTSYVVPGLSGGTKYGFLVLAYDGSTWTTYKTTLDIVYATPTGIAKPVFTVTAGKNQATVKWNAVSGAKKYRVFTYLNGKYTQAGETTSTSRVISGLTGGTKYGFLVLAYDGSTWTTYKTTLDVVYATPTK